MRLAYLTPFLILGCTTREQAPPLVPAQPTGSTDAAVGDDLPARCAPVVLPHSFVKHKVAAGRRPDASPSIHLDGDGSLRVVFADRADLEATIVAAQVEPAGDGAEPMIHLVPLTGPVYPSTTPHVAYTRAGELRTAYVARDTSLPHYVTWSGRWTDPPIDVTIGSALAGISSPDIALDERGDPVLSFVFTDQSMRLVSRVAGAWTAQIVEIGVNPLVTDMAITADAPGAPMVAATNNDPPGTLTSTLLPLAGGLTLWSRTTAGWSLERFNPDQIVGGLAWQLAPSGQPMVFFWDLTGSGGLGRLARTAGEWRLDSPLADETGRHLTGEGSVVLGGAGELHAVYQSMQGDIRYAVHDGCAWSDVVVDATGNRNPALVLDGSGRPHIAYEKGSDGEDTSEIWYASAR